MIKFNIEGGKEIEAALKRLPVEYQKKALYNAFRAGALKVAKEAARKAPTPELGEALTVRKPTRRQRTTPGTVAVVALRRPVSRLAHLFEFGSAPRKQKDGHETGQHPARPFLRPALDLMGPEAIRAIAEITKENIAEIALRLSKGQKVRLRSRR
jgi:hypothetical protein